MSSDAVAKGRSDAEVRAVVNHARRRITLDGVHNFRDLGGYPAAGGVTRWGTVYRADALQRLTARDLDILRERGLATVIDLRTDAELEARGRFPVERHIVTYHHLPIIDQTWKPGEVPEYDNAVDFLLWAYNDMLEVGGPNLAIGLELIAEAAATPLVFHCAAGKDRTGLLSALLLAVLGVPDEFIAADYAMTEEAMPGMIEAWRRAAAERSPEEAAALDDPPAYYYASPGAVMSSLFAQLTAEYGSIVDFVLAMGLSSEHVDTLRLRLIQHA